MRVTVWGENVHEQPRRVRARASIRTACTRPSRPGSQRCSATRRRAHRDAAGARARPAAGGARRHRRAHLVGPCRARRGRGRGRRRACTQSRARRHGADRRCTRRTTRRSSRRLMGTSAGCAGATKGERGLVWTVAPGPPGAAGVPQPIVIERRRCTASPSASRSPTSSCSSARSPVARCSAAAALPRGRGRVFYFSPGDQEYPVYHHPDIQRVLANAGVGGAGRELRVRGRATPAGRGRRRGVPRAVLGARAVASADTEIVGWVDVDASPCLLAARRAAAGRVAVGADLLVAGLALPTSSSTSRRHGLTGRSRWAPLRSGRLRADREAAATSMDDAREMVAAAEAARRLLMVSQNRRYMPTLLAFRDAVAGLARWPA